MSRSTKTETSLSEAQFDIIGYNLGTMRIVTLIDSTTLGVGLAHCPPRTYVIEIQILKEHTESIVFHRHGL